MFPTEGDGDGDAAVVVVEDKEDEDAALVFPLVLTDALVLDTVVVAVSTMGGSGGFGT